MMRHLLLIAILIVLAARGPACAAQTSGPTKPDLARVNEYVAEGEQAFREGKVEEGIEAFQKAIEIEARPDLVPGWHLRLGELLTEAERPKEAIASFEQAVKTAQHVAQKLRAYEALVPLYRQVEDFERAVGAYKFIRDNEPRPQRREKAAVAYYKTLERVDQLQPLLDDLWRRVESNPKDKDALEELYVIHSKATGNNPELIKTLELLRPLDPDNREYLAFLAGLYEKHQRYDDAIGVFRHMAEVYPENERPYMIAQAARVMVKAGDPDRAIATIEKVVEEHPDNNLFRIQLARMYADADRFEDAEKQYEVVIARAPGQGPSTIWLDLGELRARFGHIEKAEEAFEKALATTDEWPDRMMIEKRILLSYLTHEHEQQASQWAQKLKDLHGSPAAGVIAVAEVYYMAQQHDRALQYLEQSFWDLESWPQREELFGAYALLCERLDKMERAEALLNKVVQDPSTPKKRVEWAKEMLRHVRKHLEQKE